MSDITKNLFQKEFKYYYLFLESEVLLNPEFSQQLELFIKTIKSGRLHININFPPEYKFIIESRVNIDDPISASLNNFYNLEFHLGQNMVPLYAFDYFVTDNTGVWELYVSSNNELCIFGCDENVNSAFEVIYEPYGEETLSAKYEFLKLRFNDEAASEDFIAQLESNFHFSKSNDI